MNTANVFLITLDTGVYMCQKSKLNSTKEFKFLVLLLLLLPYWY